MNRFILTLIALAMLVIVGAATTFIYVKANDPRPLMPSGEQKALREKFFGASKELPPIKDGQEMRPRW